MNKNPKLENLKPFKPGQSGNPKGAAKKIPELNALLSNIKESDYQAIINKLTQLAKKGNVRASEVLLDRAFGKVKQDLSIVGDGLNINLVRNVVQTDKKTP